MSKSKCACKKMDEYACDHCVREGQHMLCVEYGKHLDKRIAEARRKEEAKST